MNKSNLTPECLKLFRWKIEDELWQKLMRLFAHGEECMAIEILCEELTNSNYRPSQHEKTTLISVIESVELDIDDYRPLLSGH